MASTGGKKRTVLDHRALLSAAALRLTGVIPLAGDLMILEAKPSD